jgi:hypothetical protein
MLEQKWTRNGRRRPAVLLALSVHVIGPPFRGRDFQSIQSVCSKDAAAANKVPPPELSEAGGNHPLEPAGHIEFIIRIAKIGWSPRLEQMQKSAANLPLGHDVTNGHEFFFYHSRKFA